MTQNNPNEFTFSTLIASSVHDLKNVLSSVLESLDWLSNNVAGLTDEQEGEFKKSSQLIAQVNSELMELLCFYKFEHDQYSFSNLDRNVLECLESQTLFIVSLIKGEQIKVTFSCDEDLSWNFDQTLVNTALRNAAMNALKFAKKQLNFSAKEVGGFLLLQVEDDGNGYPEEMLGKIENYIGNVTLDTNSTGLGLYFAEQVAKMHVNEDKHGYLELTNSSSIGGASFNLYLP